MRIFMEENLGTTDSLSNAIPMATEQVASPTLTQEQVNKLVAREKARAAENARREAETQYQRELEMLRQGSAQQEQRNAQVSREVDTDAIYQQIRERFTQELQQKQLEEQMQQVANNYLQKISQGKGTYSDFDEVTKEFDPSAFPQVTFLLSGIDNAADVLYELSKNPSKLMIISQMAERAPKLANSELLKLSTSIKQNQEAQATVSNNPISDPLDRLNPSRISTSNNGKMTVRDIRNQPWMRG